MRGHVVACMLLMLLSVLSGCFAGEGDPLEAPGEGVPVVDRPLQPVSDAYYDVSGGDPYPVHMTKFLASGVFGGEVRYHSWEELEKKLANWQETYPHLVELDAIGESREGRSIWRVVVTDESVDGEKLVPFFDGGHHGNEYGGSEIMLYTLDLLLENQATNQSVQRLLRELEVHVVPVVTRTVMWRAPGTTRWG